MIAPMTQDHGPRRTLGIANDSGTGVSKRAPAAGRGDCGRRPVAGAFVCEALGTFEAPKLAGVHVPELLAHGIDSLYVSYFLDTVASRIDWEELAHRREQGRQRRFSDGEEITLGSETFWLLPYGKKPYSYVLSNRDFEVRLAEHLQPCCHVQYFSEALWRDGAAALLTRLLTWAASVGLYPSRGPVVSRVDWAFDFHLPSIDFDGGNIVSRGRKKGRWDDGDAITGFQIGKGDLVVRLYDKVAEIMAESKKVWMFDLWGRRTEVWRVEFQARGPILQLHGIRTPAELMDLQYDLLRELAGTHTTLRVTNGDSNRSRWSLHPLWRALRQAIAERPQEGLIRSINPANGLRWRRYQQAKSLYGFLKGLGALMSIERGDGTILGLNETINVLRLLIVKQEYDPAMWEADLKDRIKKYASGKW
jgi:hypothetical protein